MMTTLLLRSQHDQSMVVAPDARGVLRVEGEQSWELVGPAELIKLAHADLRDVTRRAYAEMLHLDFGNAVGVFRVRELGTIEVVSGKWDESHFDAMLADVARVASALPFAAGTAGPLPYDRTLSTRDDLVYHAYVYIRHILSESAPRHVRLMPSLRAILEEPHRRVVHEVADVPTDRLQRMDHATLLAIASGYGATMESRSRRLPPALGGRLPRVLPERQCVSTVDTPENRFVKGFLEQVSAVLARMRDVCAADTRFAHRVRAECRALSDLLAPTIRHPLWREVGRMTQLPSGSTVLQQRRGYRDVYRHFALLRLATKHLPISAHEARDLLEGKDIAALYEMWCYFRVVDVVRELLGAPESVDAVKRDPLQHSISREFEVQWANGVSVLYNATFSKTKTAGRQSYSLPLRPDIVLLLPDGAVHVLDAKFKLAWLDTDADDIERATVKLDDVYKMHAYRDAIECARSAWVLYPGTEKRSFAPAAASGSSVEGVGAIPLQPVLGGDGALRDLLVAMLRPARPEAG